MTLADPYDEGMNFEWYYKKYCINHLLSLCLSSLCAPVFACLTLYFSLQQFSKEKMLC